MKVTENAYEFSLDVPGVSKENIKISIDNKTDLVEILAEEKSKEENPEGNTTTHRYYKRSFSLPEDAL